MQSRIESGAELLTRLYDKPSLHGLDDTLFVKGPGNTDVVEIDGERSAGKTLLLSQLLAKCVLPNRYGSVRINGCNASAVLINTDHQFQASKLFELMRHIVDAAYAVAVPALKSFSVDSAKADVARASLRNLRVIECYESEQFFLTLRTLDDVFIGNAEIAILAIDSITAYYWQDRENSGSIVTIDAYTKNLLKHIRAHTTRFNVATIYTRLREITFDRIGGEETVETDWLERMVDRRVRLCRTHGSQGVACTYERVGLVKRLRYRVSSNGIEWWKTDEGER